MPHVRDEAICVRHWDFSETSQTVSLFCREHGLMRGLAKGAKRAGGRFSGGIDLLTRGEVMAITKPGRELATLTDWTLLTSWPSLRSNLRANQAAYYVADVLQRLFATDDPHPHTFAATTRALDDIDAGHSAEALVVFQWSVVSDAGFRLHVEPPKDFSETLVFLPDSGSFARSASSASPAWKVRGQTVQLLVRVAEGASVNEITADADRDSVNRANRLLAAYVRHIVGSPLMTMKVLFPDL